MSVSLAINRSGRHGRKSAERLGKGETYQWATADRNDMMKTRESQQVLSQELIVFLPEMSGTALEAYSGFRTSVSNSMVLPISRRIQLGGASCRSSFGPERLVLAFGSVQESHESTIGLAGELSYVLATICELLGRAPDENSEHSEQSDEVNATM